MRFTGTRNGWVPEASPLSYRDRRLQRALKSVLDIAVAAVAIVVLLPVLMALATAILLVMGRPILFRQTRVGRDNKHFKMLKFRSLPVRDVDESESGPTWERLTSSEYEDQPSTRLGRFLRSTSLDELPQLFNVLLGQMSLVGPRPERPILVDMFVRENPDYALRHRAKVGVTGWAQVHGIGRGGERFTKETLARRVQLDNEYIDRWSLGLDLRILAMTWRAVFRFRQSELRQPEPVTTTQPPAFDHESALPQLQAESMSIEPAISTHQ